MSRDLIPDPDAFLVDILGEVGRRVGGGFRWATGTRVVSEWHDETPFTAAGLEVVFNFPGRRPVIVTLTTAELAAYVGGRRDPVILRLAVAIRNAFSN